MATRQQPRERSRGAGGSGARTRERAQQIALELFSTQGYEATSMRQIAERLGINKASLYYHFTGKEDIVRGLLVGRGDEARELAEWVRDQPRSPELARSAVLRWLDSFSMEKLRGIRFMNANPLLVRAIAADVGVDVGTELEALLPLIVPADSGPEQIVLTRMAFMSIGTAIAAAADVPAVTDEQAIAAARSAALALIDQAQHVDT